MNKLHAWLLRGCAAKRLQVPVRAAFSWMALVTAFVSGSVAPADDGNERNLSRRVEALERESRELRSQLRRLAGSAKTDGRHPDPKENQQSANGIPANASVSPNAEPSGRYSAHETAANTPVVLVTFHSDAPGSSHLTEESGRRLDWLPVLKFEDVAWRKGDFRIVPYGIGWLNMAYDTARTVTGPFTLFVASRDQEGESSFSVNARATRFGLEFSGPVIRGMDSGGRIEFDFHGLAETENRAGVLLRHAYGEFRTDQWRLVGGQTSDVISPLIPGVLNYTVGWAAGNIGYRRAQARVERYLRIDEDLVLTVQGSLNQTIVSDFVGAPDLEGEDAGWPTVMARIALAAGSQDPANGPAELGISGHVGQEQADFLAPPFEDDRRFLSWSFNTDLRVPLTEQYGVQGEFFVGEVLGTFLGGINQGIDPIQREGIRSIGGWVEGWYYLNPQLHCHAGYGIDDPNDADLSAGRRTLNQFYFANTVYDLTEMFNIGLEVSWWETRYVGLAKGEALRIEAVMKYRF